MDRAWTVCLYLLLLRPVFGVVLVARFMALVFEIDLSDFASQSLKSRENIAHRYCLIAYLIVLIIKLDNDGEEKVLLKFSLFIQHTLEDQRSAQLFLFFTLSQNRLWRYTKKERCLSSLTTA
jgi:hypothetical protein